MIFHSYGPTLKQREANWVTHLGHIDTISWLFNIIPKHTKTIFKTNNYYILGSYM